MWNDMINYDRDIKTELRNLEKNYTLRTSNY